MQVDWGKLVALLAVVISATVLTTTGKLTETALTGVYGLVAGYVMGNGRLAAKGRTPQPMIGRRQYRADDDDGAES